jgi:hypothetical protein
MSKFLVLKAYCFDEKEGTVKKGKVVDISGKELEFAKKAKCVEKYEEPEG